MADYIASDDRYCNAGFYRRCGRSGIRLPLISLGCWNNFGEPGTDAGRHNDDQSMHENAKAMLFKAFDLGITHFDLANNYGPPPGGAEERVGRVLKQELARYRDELIISTKAGFLMWPGPYGEWGARKNLLASLDHSLKRLQVDYVDIYYHHRPDPDTPLDESLGALDHAVKTGKALYAGISNYRGPLTEEAVRVIEGAHFARPIIHQAYYNMFDRWIEKELLPVTDDAGMGVIAFCPLANGMLTDKYLKGVPEHSRAASKSIFLKPEHVTDAIRDKATKLNEIAKKRGQTLAQMVLAWTLRDKRVTSALIGASRPEQIVENVKAMDNLSFTDAELAAIEQAIR